ncbi:MAG: RelA/SpoT domain-containing protein [candidate division Zixibacteria bacterium]|nr:RelA/SpoT domain-containing protein [candidate division Zixibacteria bacterium]
MRRIFISRLQEEYRDLAPLAQRFAEVLASELQQLVQRDKLALAVPIEHRVKAWSSIEEKLGRIDFHGASLTELHDLVGVRVILLFQRDLPAACRLVEEAFQVTARYNKSEQLSPEEFGYQSIHFIVRPREEWLTVPTFSAFGEFQAEFQVRTLAQHMWAAASHKLQYKQEASVPPPVRRSIHRVSALLEMVDMEFERALAERDDYRATILKEQGSRRLNADVLEANLDALLPLRNKGAFEPYSLLLWELEKLGIKTTADLQALLAKHLSAVIAKDAEYVAQGNERGQTDARTKAGVFLKHSGLVRLVLEQEFGQGFYSRIWDKGEKDEQS